MQELFFTLFLPVLFQEHPVEGVSAAQVPQVAQSGQDVASPARDRQAGSLPAHAPGVVCPTPQGVVCLAQGQLARRCQGQQGQEPLSRRARLRQLRSYGP